MKIDFDTVLLDLSGEELKDKDKIVVLKDICVNALLANIQQQGDKPEQGIVKLGRYELAKKINSGGEVELTAEEISTVKQRIGIVFGTLIVGSTTEIFEA